MNGGSSSLVGVFRDERRPGIGDERPVSESEIQTTTASYRWRSGPTHRGSEISKEVIALCIQHVGLAYTIGVSQRNKVEIYATRRKNKRNGCAPQQRTKSGSSRRREAAGMAKQRVQFCGGVAKPRIGEKGA